MKRASNLLQATLGLALLGGLSVAVVFAFQAASRNSPAVNLSATTTCIPTPVLLVTAVGTATNTPARSQITTPAFSPSVRPLPISEFIDLSPDVPDQDKARIYIFRCNGDIDVLLVGPDIQTLPLEPGDIILGTSPAESLVGHQPPRATTTTPVLETPTFAPSPELTPTPFSYPIPTSSIQAPSASAPAAP